MCQPCRAWESTPESLANAARLQSRSISRNSAVIKLIVFAVCWLQASGLSQVIGEYLVSFGELPAWLLALTLSALTAAVTEVTSNVAIATIFLPIIAELVNLAIFIRPIKDNLNAMDMQ